MPAGRSGEGEGEAGDVPRGVGRTAVGLALVRARESRRVDRLFDDPYAQAFVDAAPGAVPEEPRTREELAALGPLADLGAAFFHRAAIRTRFFDDYLLAAAAACPQVVLLAAGLDARAFRLDWPDRERLFELDLPDVLAFKERVLAGLGAVPRCRREIVPADLAGGWSEALERAGFDPAVPTAWLAEGLLVYLTPVQANRLLAIVDGRSAPGSRLAFEQGSIADDPLLRAARWHPSMDAYASLWKGGPGEQAPAWLEARGWRVEVRELGSAAAAYGRDVPDRSRTAFVTATRDGA